jgi:pimeloyl-ACP methyl ester carboxylesterase
MSTTGSRRVGRPKLRVWSVLTRRAPRDRRGYVEHFVRVFRMIGSPAYPTDRERIREVAAVSYDRGHHPAGTGRQLAAIIASGDRTPELRRLRIPTVVIHGTDDPLVPFSGARATARAIPDAELVTVPGMGHDLPRELWPLVVDTVVANAERAGVLQPR